MLDPIDKYEESDNDGKGQSQTKKRNQPVSSKKKSTKKATIRSVTHHQLEDGRPQTQVSTTTVLLSVPGGLSGEKPLDLATTTNDENCIDNAQEQAGDLPMQMDDILITDTLMDCPDFFFDDALYTQVYSGTFPDEQGYLDELSHEYHPSTHPEPDTRTDPEQHEDGPWFDKNNVHVNIVLIDHTFWSDRIGEVIGHQLLREAGNILTLSADAIENRSSSICWLPVPLLGGFWFFQPEQSIPERQEEGPIRMAHRQE